MEKEQRELIQTSLRDKLINNLVEVMEKENFIQRAFVTGLGMDRGELSRFFNRKSKLGLEKVLLMIDYLGYEVKLVKKEKQ